MNTQKSPLVVALKNGRITLAQWNLAFAFNQGMIEWDELILRHSELSTAEQAQGSESLLEWVNRISALAK